MTHRFKKPNHADKNRKIWFSEKKQIQEKYYALEKIEEPIEILKKDEKKQSWETKRSKGQNEKKINTSLKLK